MHGSLERLIDDPDVDAVWVASPSHLHAQHAIMAMDAGKHVVVEKPFAVTLEECDAMIEASKRNNVALLAGGARLRTGRPGDAARDHLRPSRQWPRALTDWSFTSFMTRARERHEVDMSMGGGMPYNQGPHVLDVLSCWAAAWRSVRAATVDTQLQGRPCPGYVTAFIEFEDGTPATFTYNGYGYVQNFEFLQGVRRRAGWPPGRTRTPIVALLRAGTATEHESREFLRYAGRPRTTTLPRPPTRAGAPATTASSSPPASWVRYVSPATASTSTTTTASTTSPCPQAQPCAATRSPSCNRQSPASRRCTTDVGKATIELLLALLESASTHREVELHQQVPVRD